MLKINLKIIAIPAKVLKESLLLFNKEKLSRNKPNQSETSIPNSVLSRKNAK